MTSAMRSSRPEQVAEVGERRQLVVDDERRESDVVGGHGQEPTTRGYGAAWMPGANLGTRNDTFVPAPTAVSTTRPNSSP